MQNEDHLIVVALLVGYPAAEHPMRSGQCPSIPEFEHLAIGKAWSFARALHTVLCHYCQISLKVMREELMTQTRWEDWQANAERAMDSFKAFNCEYAEVSEPVGIPPLQGVPGLILDQSFRREKVTVVRVMQKWISNGQLHLTITRTPEVVVPGGLLVNVALVSERVDKLLSTVVLESPSNQNECRLDFDLPEQHLELGKQIAAARTNQAAPFRLVFQRINGFAS